MTEEKAYRLRVEGRVQGVFFRESTKAKALALGLRGAVCNEADGSVTVLAEGNPEALAGLLEWCHQGPPLAKVREVKCEPATVQGFESFVVTR